GATQPIGNLIESGQLRGRIEQSKCAAFMCGEPGVNHHIWSIFGSNPEPVAEFLRVRPIMLKKHGLSGLSPKVSLNSGDRLFGGRFRRLPHALCGQVVNRLLDLLSISEVACTPRPLPELLDVV